MSHLVHLLTLTWPIGAGGSVKANATLARNLLDAAPRDRRLIVVFPEPFLMMGVAAAQDPRQFAQIVDAAGHTLHAACQGIDGLVFIPTVRAGAQSISFVTDCVDGSGTCIATYTKCNTWPDTPALDRFEFDVSPGKDAPLTVTLGPIRIGVQMCFDVNWAAGWDHLRDQRADLIVFPSSYPAGFSLRARAWQANAVIAAATPVGPSPVIDLTGEVLTLRTPAENRVPQPLNLNRARVHRDHAGDGFTQLVKRTSGVRVKRLPNDNTCLVEAPADGAHVASLLTEVGLRPEHDYLRAAGRAIDSARAQIRRPRT